MTSDDPIHPEGIYVCRGCGRTYPEYINGCVEDHGRPRCVVLAAPEAEFAKPITRGMSPVEDKRYTPIDTDEFQRVRDRGAAEARTAHFYRRRSRG